MAPFRQLTSAVVLMLLFAASMACALTTKHFCFSTPFLLGGGLTSCRTPTDTTSCSGGYASSEAWMRYFRSQWQPSVHLFPLDFLSPFTQMHRLKWDVNAKFYQHYNAPAWVALPNILVGSNNPQLNAMLSESFPWVMTNVNVKPNSQFDGYRTPSFVDPETEIGYLVLGSASNAELNDDIIASSLRGIQHLWRHSPQPKHVVIFDISAGTGSNYTNILGVLQQNPYLKIDAYYAMDSTQTVDSITTTLNSTFVAIVKGEGYSRSGLPSTNLVCLDMQVDSAGKISNISLGAYPIAPLPANLRDANYYADVAFSQALAEEAIKDDPVVGYTTAMPLTSDTANNIANCFAGDCGLGNLFTDAFAWRMDADMAFVNSGGLRGSGWVAGEVKFSRTFESTPWPDTMNVARLTGLSVWEILNHTVGVPFNNQYIIANNYLLQTSGIRVTYSNNIGPFKLVSVEVYNKAKKVYEPLDRLKLYTVVFSVFEVCCMEPYASIMTKKRYRGETSAEDHPDLPQQNVVAQFLTGTTTASNPYVVTQYQRYVAASTPVTAANAMNWHQVQSDCPVNTFWDAGIATCMPCPAGMVQPLTGQLGCQASSSTTDFVIIIAPIVAILLIIIAVVGFLAARGAASARSIKNAPTSGRITIMFTDIQDSTQLWGALPMSMNHALGLHHEIIRATIAKHKGYEVKTIGDSFMIAVSSEEVAVQIAVDIQRSLQAASWPPSIAQMYNAKNDEELEEIDDDPFAVPDRPSKSEFNGVRVRIGIHSGAPRAELDPVTKGYDYYGAMVNVASRVEGFAKGGQICVTADVFQRLKSARTGVDIKPLGKCELKGVVDAPELFDVMPEELLGRRLAWAGSDGNGEKQESNTDQTSDTGSAYGDQGNLDYNAEQLTLYFLQFLLKGLGMGEGKKVRASILSAWHVPDDAAEKKNDENGPEKRLCRRVLPSVLRKIKKQVELPVSTNANLSTEQQLTLNREKRLLSVTEVWAISDA